MGLLSFISDFRKRKEGLKEYTALLKQSLSDGSVSKDETAQLKDVADKFGLRQIDCEKAQRNALSEFFTKVSSDQRITEEERKQFNDLLNHFGVDLKDISSFNQDNFNKYNSLASIEKGILPTAKIEGFNLLFKSDEIMHYGEHAILVKIRKVTKRLNYSGFTGSIKIAKGIRYRVGSVKFKPETVDIANQEDTGLFYATNQRVGFLGKRKQFSMPYSKISSFELRPEGLYIFKDGKEAPYIVAMSDYEVMLAIISHVLSD